MSELQLHIAMWTNLSYTDTKEYIQHESIYPKLWAAKTTTVFGYAYKGGKAIKESKEMIDHSTWNHDLF